MLSLECTVCHRWYYGKRVGKFCSNACRQRRYRRRQKFAAAAKPIEESLARAHALAARLVATQERYAITRARALEIENEGWSKSDREPEKSRAQPSPPPY